MSLDLDLALATARRAVDAASTASLAHFRTGVRVETKPDRTPVTAADRDAEAAVVATVRAAFPSHAILGEETGAHAGDAATRWIVDPIDGTRGFTRGGSFWGPLVALEHEGTVVAGAMAMPALGETYWAARGRGAWMARDGGPPVQLRVSGIGDWAEASLSFGEFRGVFAPERERAVLTLARTAAQARCYGDLAGAAMVLTGRAEAWIEAGVQVWDIAPLLVLAAGGRGTIHRPRREGDGDLRELPALERAGARARAPGPWPRDPEELPHHRPGRRSARHLDEARPHEGRRQARVEPGVGGLPARLHRVALQHLRSGPARVRGGGGEQRGGEAGPSRPSGTKKHGTDQTGVSSTGASVRERARRGKALRGSTAHQPTGPSAS